ncbi:uncharacterized protein LOC110838102 isoform X2 [Zootermopsis nevadensis]|uniref:uncharacterized protein LOC110838102 isoform X2 n=1 Tax=Zootermopsis nevadensis TaxID=136037 RepID=UPI000B8E48B0|nr:uncharacterized protein LOC110838102 isoform X2 [Zootermopsis nevadensis]
MLTECTMEVSNDGTETMVNCVQPIEEVFASLIETEEEDLVFSSKERMVEENEQEIKIPLASQGACEISVNLTPDEKVSLENLSSEITSVSKLGFDTYSSASETDHSVLIVTRPLENKTSTEECGVEFSCSNVLLCAPKNSENKGETPELCEIECEEQSKPSGVIPLGSPDLRNTAQCELEVTLNTGLKSMEAVLNTVSSNPLGCHTLILKCETGSCTLPDLQNTIVTKAEVCEEVNKPTVDTKNASHVGQQTKVPFQNATSKELSSIEEHCLSLHKQDVLIASNSLTLESEKSSAGSSLNDLTHEENSIIPTDLIHKQIPIIDTDLLKWGPEESKCCEQASEEDLEHIPDIVRDVHKLHFEENSMLKVSYFEQVTAETPNFAGHISVPDSEEHNTNFNSDLTDSFRTTETTHTKSPEFAEDILNVEENNENCSSEMSAYEQIYVRPIEIKHPDFVTDVLELYAKEIKESCDSGGISCEKVYMVPVEIKNVQSPDLTINVEKRNESSKFSSYKQMSFDPQKQFRIFNPGQDIAETKEMCNSHLKNCEQASVEVLDLVHMPLSHIFSDKEEKVVGADDSWKQNQFDSNSRVLMEDFLLGERLASGLTTSGLDIKAEENFDATGEVEDDGEDFGLDAVKHLTPDDERSSDSGFRDKGSLSESCEEVCDEKYNLEDIEAELEDTFNRGNFNYVDEHDNEEEQNERALEDQQGKLSAKSSDDSPFIYIEEPGNGNQNHRTMEDIERKLPVRSCVDKVYNIEDLDCCDIVHNENSTDKTFEAVGGKLTKVIDMLESVEKDQAGGQFAGEVTESVIKDQLKNESLDSGDSDMKRSPELIRIQCDIDNHDDTSTGFHQPELLSVAGDYKEPILLVKLQEDIETNIIKNYTSVNKINQLLESGRESQNSEMLNLDSDTRQWQIIMDSNVIEHVSDENKQNRYPVTVPASDSRPVSLTNVIPDINLTTEIHVPDKHFSNHEVKHDAILSSISPDDKVVSQMDGYCLRSTQKSGLNAYQTFSFGETCANEDACEVGDKPESASRELQHSELVQRHTTGWYLHPPLENGNYEDSKGDLVNLEECPSVTDSGPCSSKYEESNNGDNSYVSFSLDEEFVTAIRNELRDKLPCTRQQSQEEEDSEEDEILDPDDDLPQEERTDIMIHYNTYSAPLSPILEEHESGSSVTTTVSDHYSSLALSNQRDAPVSGSDSEPLSPVFVLDPRDGDSRAQYEINAKKFEQEIREALENCSLNSEGSEDISSPSNKVHNESSVLLEDLEQQPSVDTQGLSLNVTVNENIVVVHGTHQHPNGDDLLVVNTETNEATLLESLTPKSHLAFVNNRRTLQEGKSIDGLSGTPNFFGENEVIVGVNSDTFVIDRSRLIGTFEVDSKLGAGKEMSSDDEVYTPDSISEHVTGTPSESTLQSPDTENLSDFFLTPSEKSPAVSECPLGPQNSSVFNSYLLHSLSKNHDNQIFEKVQEISLGVANNEAAEIISELENSGIFNNNNNDANKETCAAVLPLCEKVSIQELPSSRTSSVNDNNEVLSVEDSSESSELTKKDSDDDKNNPARLSAVDRLDYLTSPNLDVFSMKIKESTENSEEEENSMNGNSCNRRLFLNDTLDLLKRRKDSRQNDSDLYQEDEERDWSLPNLEASILSTKAPMPSPEEESWKQIPSMLAFSDLNEVMSRCGNKQQAFDTISFNGPSQCVSYSGQTEVDDGDLMSTSFSIKGDPGDPECYTPDWESDSDETNEEDNSSSSGEFIWKPYEGLSDFPMEVIAEEEEDEEEEDDDDDDADGSSSSGSGTEFVPSAWNSEATPNRSALRSPDKKSDHKKNVSFKKQKYHSVYEYPRETSDSDSEGFDSPTRRHWNSLMLQSTQQPQVDYSSFADWEMLDGDVLPEGSVPDMDIDQDIPENTTQQQLDIYKLSSVDYDFTNGMVSEDGEFYISSSARPFQFPGGSNDVLTSSGSQFFPGQLYHVGSEYKPSEITVDFVTPDVDIVNITVADKLSALETGVDSYNDEVDTSPSSMSRFSVSFNDQLTNHKSESIKGIVWEDEIDSSESGVNGTSSNRSSASSDVGEKASLESTKLQELPFTDLLELAKASDPTSSIVLSVSVTNEMLSGAKSVSGCVITDKDCETVLQSPSSPLSPSGLGELRHTRDRLKLDLPLSSTAFVLDPPAVGKRRSVETVKGEASLLDSGEETEDSGIESSNGAVTREVKSPTRDISMT